MSQTPEQRQNLINKIGRRMNHAMERGLQQAIANAPVDTSSLQESGVRHQARIEQGNIVAVIEFGGIDFSGQIMAKTGKEGRNVTYAQEQEVATGFLSSAIPVIVQEMEN